MLYDNSAVQFRDVTDGDTNTLLLGDSLYGFWGDGFSCCVRIRDDRRDFDEYWMDSSTGLQFVNFGSFHDDIAQFALVDGSVRSISKNIDARVFRAIATRNGREQITDAW